MTVEIRTAAADDAPPVGDMAHPRLQRTKKHYLSEGFVEVGPRLKRVL